MTVIDIEEEIGQVTLALTAHVFDSHIQLQIERSGSSVDAIFEHINRCGLTDGEERWWPTHQIQRIEWRAT